MFRRRKADDPDLEAGEETGSARPAAQGPWDAADVDLDDHERIDLGGLLVTPHPELDLQLQVDEASGQVIAAVLAGSEGAVELRAFAAPRNGDIWDDVRRGVAAEIARMGGTATEVQGPFGKELKVALGVELPDGSRGNQISRVVGIAGPRWLLRATLFGGPAVEWRADGAVETALRDVVVVRGSGPIPPGDQLPLTVPPNAQRVDPS